MRLPNLLSFQAKGHRVFWPIPLAWIAFPTAYVVIMVNSDKHGALHHVGMDALKVIGTVCFAVVMLDRACGSLKHRRQNTADRWAWHTAQTLRDVGNRTADYLRGDLKWQPVCRYTDGTAPETEPLIDVLVAMNRAGVVTTGSQAGHVGPNRFGDHIECRAWVDGLTDFATVLELRCLIVGTRFQLAYRFGVPRRLKRKDPKGGWEQVTPGWDVNDLEYATPLPHKHFEMSYGGAVSDEAYGELHDACQFSIIDPEPGTNELFELLGRRFGAKVKETNERH